MWQTTPLLCIFSIQQSPVLSDLHLQPGLDVQQNLVFRGLPLDVRPHLAELILQRVDHGLELVQLQAVAGLCLSQLALQGRFLYRRKNTEEGMRTVSSTVDMCMCACGVWLTRLSWDCSSIWSACRVLLSSLISLREVWRVSELVATCLFRSSNWKT